MNRPPTLTSESHPYHHLPAGAHYPCHIMNSLNDLGECHQSRIRQATPPVGVNLFTAANLIKGNIDDVAKEAIPFVAMDVIVLIILSLFPILSLYLPVLAGLYTP